MESHILGIKTKVPEPRVLRENPGREPHAIKPIPKDEGALFGGHGRETAKRQAHTAPPANPSKVNSLGDEVHCSVSSVKNSPSLELYDKAGGLVVRAISPDAKEIFSKTGSEDRSRLREKSDNHRGVLFTRKA